MGYLDYLKNKNDSPRDSEFSSNKKRDAVFLSNVRYNDDPPDIKLLAHDSIDLFYAAYNGDLAEVERLLAYGANPDVRVHGYPAIYYPVLNGSNAICFALLDAGADPNIEYPGGLFPLYAAAELGNLDLVKKLVACGAEIDKKTLKGNTALKNAAEEGHYAVVEYLLDRGADIFSVNVSGHTVLEAAESEGRLAVAKLLRERQAAIPSHRDDAEALQRAARSARADSYRSSLESYNNFKLHSWFRDSLLTMGIIEDKPRLVKQGLENGEDPNRRYSYEKDSNSLTIPNSVVIITPIVQAAVTGNLEIAKLLIEHGADPNLAQKNGEYALLNAVSRGNMELTKYLLDNGANPNLDTGIGTALAFADNTEIMKVLFEYGANPNIPDRDGDLPIIGSIDTGRMDEIELLIDFGTDMNHKNKRGISALDHAARRGIYDQVIQMVKQR